MLAASWICLRAAAETVRWPSQKVSDAAAELCARLLVACDDVKIVATSREPLRVAGEARYRLVPLALPDLEDLTDAAGTEAVALFADRARSADAVRADG